MLIYQKIDRRINPPVYFLIEFYLRYPPVNSRVRKNGCIDFTFFALSIKSRQKIAALIFPYILWLFQKRGKKLTYLSLAMFSPINILFLYSWSITIFWYLIDIASDFVFEFWGIYQFFPLFLFCDCPIYRIFKGFFCQTILFYSFLTLFYLLEYNFNFLAALELHLPSRFLLFTLLFHRGAMEWVLLQRPGKSPGDRLVFHHSHFVENFLFCQPNYKLAAPKYRNHALFSIFMSAFCDNKATVCLYVYW